MAFFLTLHLPLLTVSKILIVDDSATDRTFVGGLLRRAGDDWYLHFADNGEAALQRMKVDRPDIVLTDLRMPVMDGFELVDRVKQKYPKVPVVLMTAHDSGANALKALQLGATSYVPKSQLPQRLVATVRQVLEVVNGSDTYRRLIDAVDENHFRFHFDNDPSLIPPLIDVVQRVTLDLNLFDAPGRRQLGIAVYEALFNAMYHGNLELPIEHLEQTRLQLRKGMPVRIIDERRSQYPYHDRQVFVSGHFGSDEVRIVVRDQGAGFNFGSISKAPDACDLQKSGGRGLVLIKAFVDEIHFNAKGNELTMVKRQTTNLDYSD